MLKDLSRARLAGAWCAVLVVIGSLGVAAGAPVSTSNFGMWLAACLVPPSVMLVAWRGAPPLTIAEVLYAANRPPV
jgi:hypothetical protein